MNGYEIQWKFYYSSEIDVFFFTKLDIVHIEDKIYV